MRLFINTFLLVLLLGASVAVGQQVPGIIVHLDNSLYFPGNTLAFRCVALRTGLPATVDYGLRVEKKETVVTGFLGGLRPGAVIVPSGPQEQWVEVERHSATCHPGEMVQVGPFVSRTARTEPFARIPISQTNEVWQTGLYRVRVQSVPLVSLPQLLYFKVDLSAPMPIEPRAEKVAGGMRISGIPAGYVAIVSTRNGVGTQLVPVGNPDAFLPLLQPEALGVPIILTIYNPYEVGGRDGGQETATFVVP